MKKKIALFLAAALLSVGLIVSCGGGGDDDGDGPGTTPAGTQYTVSFDTDGGTPAKIESIKVDAGKTVGAAKWPDAPKKGDDTFKGWFEGATEYKYDSQINKNVALKAKWEAFKWPDPLLDFESFHVLGDFTNSNPGDVRQRGWLFGEGGDDYAFTNNTWLLVETKASGNMNGFVGLQLTFIDNDYAGLDVATGKFEQDLVPNGWVGYTKTEGEIFYYAIKLSAHANYADFKAAVTADSYTLYLGSYPWIDLGFLNAYLVEENLNKVVTDSNKKATLNGTFGFIMTAKDDGIDWDNLFSTAFVPVTDINYTGPAIGRVGEAITLAGTTVPAGATNTTIVWSGTGVTGNTLTATAAGDVTVTATIADGTAVGTPKTKTFTIKIYTVAVADVTLDLTKITDSGFTVSANSVKNTTIFNNSQYAEIVLDISPALTEKSITADVLATFKAVSITAKFYDRSNAEISMDNKWGVSSIKFSAGTDGGTPFKDYYNFGTITGGSARGTNLTILENFMKDGAPVLPKSFVLQKADNGGDGTLGYIEITGIKFLKQAFYSMNKSCLPDHLSGQAGGFFYAWRRAETILNKGSLVTADHHEIEPVEIAEKINVTWFR